MFVFSNILLAIPAVICGSVALRRIKSSGEGGRGMAMAGLLLGVLGVLYFVLIVVVVIAHGRPVTR